MPKRRLESKPEDTASKPVPLTQQPDPSAALAQISERLQGTVLPKRRRVVRACDRCRKLKIKCSGDIPCIHCTVYSYECTYNQRRAKRAKRPSQTGTAALASSNPELFAKMSDRLKLYDDILHRLLPEIKLTDLNDNPQPVNPMKLMAALNSLREKGIQDAIQGSAVIANEYEGLPEIPVPHIPTVKMPIKEGVPASPSSLTPTRGSSEDFSLGREIKIILPSREVALQLISKTWGSACVLFRFYHRPAFIEDLNELYDTDPSQYTNKQQRFLPLVYSVLACGALFFKSERSIANVAQPEDVEDEGYRYFIAARKLIDITDTRDTYGIQTIVMLIIFLQCSARLSTCYAYIGIALRAALREGLHRKLDYPFNPIELETRKRLFWTLYKMDIYVNTMLGLPRTISEDDFDQELPVELDDENITVTGYRWDRQRDRLSSSGIANAHTKLMQIMGHVLTRMYPIKPSAQKKDTKKSSLVSQCEQELQDWLASLPEELKPGVLPSDQYLRANRMLHVSYLHVRIMLYRPFIHYIASADTSSSNFAKAQNCINVARVVVKLAQDMIARQLLTGSYWFSVYTIFFSVACLVYYVHYARPYLPNGEVNAAYLEIKKDTESGKRVLDQLKDTSTAARRTYNILHSLFQQMNKSQTSGRSSLVKPDAGISQGTSLPLVMDGVNQIDGIPTGINLDTADPSGASFDPSFVLPTSPIDSQYVPGPMDQLDMKIFGRFLPPYMLNQAPPTPEPTVRPYSNDFLYQHPQGIPSGLSTVVQSEREKELDRGKEEEYGDMFEWT